jgi:hypothetical protein
MAEELLFGSKAMTESKMRKVLATYNVGSDVSELSKEEVIQMLSSYVDQDAKQFFENAQGSDIDIKYTISESVKAEKIKFDKSKRTWVWGRLAMTPDGEIVKVPQGYNEIDFLVNHLIKQENIDILTEIELQLENKSINV